LKDLLKLRNEWKEEEIKAALQDPAIKNSI